MDRLEELRKEIDVIDKSLAELFEIRMRIAKEIGEYKAKNNIPICDSCREAQVIENNSKYIQDETIRKYYVEFIKNVMALSKDYQK